MKKTLKIILFGIITVFIMIEQSTQSNELFTVDADFSLTKEEERVESKAEKHLISKAEQEVLNPLFDVCQHEITDYQYLRTEIDKLYPIGTDASVLFSNLEGAFGKPLKEEKVIDYLFVANKNEAIANSWLYGFRKECNYSPEYSVQWSISILTDLSKKITAINIRPSIQTTDFSLIQIPFNFDYFYNPKDIKRALWNLTGTGIAKNKILKFMTEIDGGYGDLEPIERDSKNVLVYQYRYKKTDFIPIRIYPSEFDSIVIWEFDDEDKLINLIVQ